ncbi:MAG: sigma-54 dependent transcriptional regulator [Bacteroidia bacterium]|nr:sigma-54 dependent transcriptional regulator [Bacteroidia bacterium]MDW8301597.1 sigma-54 dependent transcriptional regulator [Bacteroidia bacterium]
MSANILVIDDERSIRNTLKDILQYENYQVDEAENGEIGLEKIKKKDYNVVLCDIKMPKKDGIEVLEEALSLKPDISFIMISGHADMDMAVQATKKGAYDFIQKPLDLNRLLVSVRNALDRTALVSETKSLKRKVSKITPIIGQSEGIKKVLEMIDKVAPTNARVMITGSNGTGKELVARWIHEKSQRSKGPMVEVNCAAIPSELIESELFGHEKGSFTSAIKQRIGKFEQANGGTLFLDEIGDMSLSAQAKVLRALQENKITRVGGEKEIPIDVRVIAATNKDLRKEIEKGNFREDLFFRLNAIEIHVPALKERIDDIPLLVESFLKDICQEYGIPTKTITNEAIAALQKLPWRGNIRELKNVVERLVILCPKNITEQDVHTYVGQSSPANSNELTQLCERFDQLKDFINYTERVFLSHKLKQNQWDKLKTAELIGIKPAELERKIQALGIEL